MIAQKRKREQESDAVLPSAKRGKTWWLALWEWLTSPPIPVPLPRIEPQNILDEIYWAHGTTSATLALFQFTGNFLYAMNHQPFIQEGAVPFVGAFDRGLSLSGVNQWGISGQARAQDPRFVYAWEYATHKNRTDKSVLDNITCKLKETLQKILTDVATNPVPAIAAIELLLVNIQRFKMWDREAFTQFLKQKDPQWHKTYHALIQKVARHCQFSFSLISSRMILLTKIFQISAFDSLKRDILDNLQLPDEHYLPLIIPNQLHPTTLEPEEKLVLAIYSALRKARFLLHPLSRPYTSRVLYESILQVVHKSRVDASFIGGDIVCFESHHFDAGIVVIIIRHLIDSGQLPEFNRYQRETSFSVAQIQTTIAQMQQRFENHVNRFKGVIQQLHKACAFDLNQTQRDLIRDNIPLLFSSKQQRPEMKPQGREVLWEKDKLQLGTDLEVLVTDTPEHQKTIRDFVENTLQIKTVKVGLYLPRA